MATQLTRPLTYDDLLNTPDDHQRYEIIQGELFVSPSPMTTHQRVITRLIRLLDAAVDEHDLGLLLVGPVDVRLGMHTVVAPDLVFVRAERVDIVQKQLIEGPPDLVIEVASPSTRRRDIVQKAAAYAEAGVAEYWLPDPERRSFRMLVLRDGLFKDVEQVDGRFHSAVIEGLAIDPATLFTGLD
jgi:Uma2 family endonuclease